MAEKDDHVEWAKLEEAEAKYNMEMLNPEVIRREKKLTAAEKQLAEERHVSLESEVVLRRKPKQRFIWVQKAFEGLKDGRVRGPSVTLVYEIMASQQFCDGMIAAQTKKIFELTQDEQNLKYFTANQQRFFHSGRFQPHFKHSVVNLDSEDEDEGGFVPVLKDDNKKKPKWKIRQERRGAGLPSDSEDENYQADLEKAMAAKLEKMKAAKQGSSSSSKAPPPPPPPERADLGAESSKERDNRRSRDRGNDRRRGSRDRRDNRSDNRNDNRRSSRDRGRDRRDDRRDDRDRGRDRRDDRDRDRDRDPDRRDERDRRDGDRDRRDGERSGYPSRREQEDMDNRDEAVKASAEHPMTRDRERDRERRSRDRDRSRRRRSRSRNRERELRTGITRSEERRREEAEKERIKQKKKDEADAIMSKYNMMIHKEKVAAEEEKKTKEEERKKQLKKKAKKKNSSDSSDSDSDSDKDLNSSDEEESENEAELRRQREAQMKKKIERRIDPADGQMYSLEDFVEEYGGSIDNPPKEWEIQRSTAFFYDE